jgi:predicted O-methyltransferase YrrM
MTEASREHLFEELLREHPRLHGSEESLQDWSLREDGLRWLWARLQPGWSTLETGCGYSTIVFALRGTSHTVVSPDVVEHQRVVDWCADRGVSLDSITFLAGPSQWQLPLISDRDLDLFLVDGDHAFPVPSLDWYYGSVLLHIGGLLVLDDVDIRAVHVLRDFLARDTGRWRLRATLHKTVVFEKLTSEVLPDSGWLAQPWGARKVITRADRVAEFRRRVRLRTRLRSVLRTSGRGERAR